MKKNNKIIKEIEEKVKIKVGSTDSFKIENMVIDDYDK